MWFCSLDLDEDTDVLKNLFSESLQSISRAACISAVVVGIDGNGEEDAPMRRKFKDVSLEYLDWQTVVLTLISGLPSSPNTSPYPLPCWRVSRRRIKRRGQHRRHPRSNGVVLGPAGRTRSPPVLPSDLRIPTASIQEVDPLHSLPSLTRSWTTGPWRVHLE